MTWTLVAFAIGGLIGFAAGWNLGDAILQAVRAESARIENELTEEIKRLRTQVATHIGGEL